MKITMSLQHPLYVDQTTESRHFAGEDRNMRERLRLIKKREDESHLQKATESFESLLRQEFHGELVKNQVKNGQLELREIPHDSRQKVQMRSEERAIDYLKDFWA